MDLEFIYKLKFLFFPFYLKTINKTRLITQKAFLYISILKTNTYIYFFIQTEANWTILILHFPCTLTNMCHRTGNTSNKNNSVSSSSLNHHICCFNICDVSLWCSYTFYAAFWRRWLHWSFSHDLILMKMKMKTIMDLRALAPPPLHALNIHYSVLSAWLIIKYWGRYVNCKKIQCK